MPIAATPRPSWPTWPKGAAESTHYAPRGLLLRLPDATRAALPRAAAAALVIRARSSHDDRSVCGVHVPDPVVDGSAAHVRGTAVFQAPCSPSDFAVLHRQLADGSAIRQRGRRNGTTRQPRALPLWNGQGNAALVPSPNPRQKYNGAHSTPPPGRHGCRQK